jgi:hypothetical protein
MPKDGVDITMTFKDFAMNIKLILATFLSSIILAACSHHIAPNEDDIKHAIEEGRDLKVSNVNIQSCERHNGVDSGDDPHFDFYACVFTATFTDSSGKSISQESNGVFESNSDGWHDTR